MGTEFLTISLFTTPTILLVNLGILFRGGFPNPKAIIMLLSNVLFILFFIVTGLIDGYLKQAIVIGGFLLIPFQLITLILATILGKSLREKLRRISEAT